MAGNDKISKTSLSAQFFTCRTEPHKQTPTKPTNMPGITSPGANLTAT
jgi:hypothetical protein